MRYIEYDPGPEPNRADRIILACLEHQVTIAMILWLLIIGGVTAWWLG